MRGTISHLDLTEREMSVAAGIVELLASRAGGTPPPWTSAIGAVREELVLDPGLDEMPRSYAVAKRAAPEPLRRRISSRCRTSSMWLSRT